jgi:hypothetical protein
VNGPRGIYAVVNLVGGVGAVEWRENVDDLPTWDKSDLRYRIVVPDGVTDDGISSAMDALLGDYDLPDDWECGPI